MKQDIQYKKQPAVPSNIKKKITQSEPAFLDMNKLKEKLNSTQMNLTPYNSNPVHNHTDSSKNPGSARYDQVRRTQELHDYNFDDLIKLI